MTRAGDEGLGLERLPDGVVQLTIRGRDKVNSLNEQDHRDLAAIWPELNADPGVRVIVVTGEGRAFCAGGNMEMEQRLAGDYAGVVQTLTDARDLVLNMVNCDKPIISAINGGAAGAGLATALMADISIIGEDVVLADGHTRIGITAGDHAALIWPLLCGMARAKYYLLTCDRIDGCTAAEIGLVSKAVPAEQVLPEALALAHRLAAGPQHALRWTKRSLNHFAEHALAGPPEATVLVARSETRPRIELTRGELRARVASLRAALQGLGVGPGDRVAAYLPNIPEAMITLYAAASLGAIFTCCAPESGTRSVISRIGQVEPAVLVTVDGYVYGGQRYDRTAEVAAIRAAVPSIRATIAVPYLEPVTASSTTGGPDSLDWNDLMARPADLEFAAVPFAHPLYIVYSSGTTGRPKAIIHGHGGILLEHLKLFLLHDDLGPADRWFWYSSTNWMAWNYGASVLLGGGSLLIFDGHPMRPELADYWRMVGDEGVTCLGTSPGFLLACQKQGLVPRQAADLSALRTINCGGAPLTADLFRWVYRAVKQDVYLGSGSGGTDVASSFVSGCRLLPVRAGEIACRLLGVDAQAFNDAGQPVVGERGELVIRQPMPSMPVGFWGDPGGQRLVSTYFERFPGVWCHGDWVTFSAYGTCQVTGRSDATLNRGGVRLGTSEFYAVIDEDEEITDSLVVHLEDANGGPGQLILFIVTRDGAGLTGEAAARIRSLLREQLSPRHQPDLVRQVAVIPRTLTGKRMEVPVKRVLLDPGAAAPAEPGEPDALAEFRDLGRELAAAERGARPGARQVSAPHAT